MRRFSAIRISYERRAQHAIVLYALIESLTLMNIISAVYAKKPPFLPGAVRLVALVALLRVAPEK